MNHETRLVTRTQVIHLSREIYTKRKEPVTLTPRNLSSTYLRTLYEPMGDPTHVILPVEDVCSSVAMLVLCV